MKKPRQKLLLFGMIAVVALFIFAYGRYGVELGKFFAAEPSVTGSSLCAPTQQTILSGKTAMVSLVIPKPRQTVSDDASVKATVKPTPTRNPPIYVAKWTADMGNPKAGTGNSFSTIFTNVDSQAAVMREIVVNYNGQKGVCSVTVLPIPTPTPPSVTPLGVPVVTVVPLPSTTLSNGQMTIAKISIGSAGATTWIRRMTFGIKKSLDLSLNNGFSIYEDGVNISALAQFQIDPGILPGQPYATVKVLFNAERKLGHTYEFRANVTGVMGTGSYITTSINNPNGSGPWEPLPFAGNLGSQGSSATLIWTDHAAAGHSDYTRDWYSDRNVRILPTAQFISTQ